MNPPGLRAHRRSQIGIAAVETLLAAPVVLLLGLSVLQWGLLFHGRGAVAHAAQEAARAGSVDHASAQAIERGLSRGLAPWLHGASGPEEHAANLERTRAHLAQGEAAGWVAWRRLAPTAESFTDWAEPARDDDGEPIAGLIEIPNDNLALRTGMRLPASGVAGHRGAEPIGSVSRQTLSDANLLKIEVVYGVPLTVPLIGRAAAWMMRAIDGCSAGSGVVPAGGFGVSGPGANGGSGAGGSAPAGSGSGTLAPLRLGAVALGTPAVSASPRAWACAHYNAVGDTGRPQPRWPVRVSATVRMQSPARDADSAPALETGANPGPVLGPGQVDREETFRPIAPGRQNPGGASPTQDGSHDRAPGFLKLGGDRLTPPPGACASS